MIEDFLPLQITKPGFFANGTRYQAKGRWHEGNLVRFHERTIQPIGGWVQHPLSGDTIVGTPLAAVCWQGEDGTPFLAVGTTNGLYVIDANDVCYDVTPDNPTNIGDPPYDWQLSTFGAYLVATNSLRGDEDLSLANVYVWTGDTGAAATPAWTLDIGPAGAYSCFATPERQLVVLRGKDPTTRPARTGVDSVYSERRLYFSDTEALDGFVSTDTNEGGDFDLQTPGRMVVGTQGKGESLLWTDVDLWKMQFVGGEFVYVFQKAGDDCGIISKRAFVQIDKGAYWMGRGKFFVYNGFTQSIPCEVTDHVFGDFNESRASTVWAFSNARFNEITWFYPSAGSAHPDRYVTYNHVEDHWVFGELDRVAGVPKRFNEDVIDEVKPAFFDTDGNLFAHETTAERDTLAWLASGPVELGNGDKLMRLQGIFPDERVAGDVQLRVYTSMAADALETDHGPYTLGPQTNLRLTARQIRLRIEEVSGDSWRVGDLRLAVRPVERRGGGVGAEDLVPASLEIIPHAVTLINAQHYTFQSIVRNAAGQVLDIEPDVWTSDNSAQVPVDDTGTVTALATPATANIQAFITSPALSSNIAVVTVAGSEIPVSIEITPAAEDVVVDGAPVTLTAVVKNAQGQAITTVGIDTWTSDDESAATVAGNGGLNLTADVSGVAAGAANITASITSPALTSNISVATVTDPFVTHTFLASGQFNVTTLGTGLVRALVVGAGASGGSVSGTGVGAGGGGGGEANDSGTESIAISLGDNPVNIGVGGAGVAAENTPGLTVRDGNAGGPTTFSSLTARGGGYGSATGAGGTVDSASVATSCPGGARGSNTTGGDGTGANLSSNISGTVETYSSGGTGSPATSGNTPGADSPAGAAGCGSGGGTGGRRDFDGGFLGIPGSSGNGGNGIVIIRYKVSTGIVATGGVKVVHN